MGTLAAEIRDRLGPLPELSHCPLVSIVVLNRDGVDHLRRLLDGLIEHTDYPRLELIVVDNGSADDSLAFLRGVKVPFPLRIVANPHNESFSDANNQGAALAHGELLLFLNNDIEPFEAGWLRELVACMGTSGPGAVGATLIYPDGGGYSSSGYRVQTQPARLRGDRSNLAVDSADDRREPFDEGFGEDVDSPSLVGACILIALELFREIGGFTHGYFYGGEDDDLSLKVRERGLSVLYSGRSFLIHHLGSTTGELFGEAGGPVQNANVLLAMNRWGARIWREHHLDRLAGGGLWAADDPQLSPDLPSPEEVQALGFCLKTDGLPPERRRPIDALEAALERRQHRCLVLHDDTIADRRGLLFDVAVHLRGPNRYVPVPGRLNVLWVVGHDVPSAIEFGQYDLVVTSGGRHAAPLGADSQPTPTIALSRDREADDLIDAVLERARQIDFPTRIGPREGRSISMVEHS